MRLTKEQRETLRMMFGGVCAYCGHELGSKWHADHVEPVVRNDFSKRLGGPPKPPEYPERDCIENMMPACPPCNIDKHSFGLEGWRVKLQRACDVLRAHQPTYRHALRFGLVKETGTKIVFHFEKVLKASTSASGVDEASTNSGATQ